MIIHLAIRDTKHNGAYDSPHCNSNLGVYHSQYNLTDDKSKVTCKRCLNYIKSNNLTLLKKLPLIMYRQVD